MYNLNLSEHILPHYEEVNRISDEQIMKVLRKEHDAMLLDRIEVQAIIASRLHEYTRHDIHSELYRETRSAYMQISVNENFAKANDLVKYVLRKVYPFLFSIIIGGGGGIHLIINQLGHDF